MMHIICRFSAYLPSPHSPCSLFPHPPAGCEEAQAPGEWQSHTKEEIQVPAPGDTALNQLKQDRDTHKKKLIMLSHQDVEIAVTAVRLLCISVGTVSKVEGKHCGGYAKQSIWVQGENVIASA